jgi:hypothetical protein
MAIPVLLDCDPAVGLVNPDGLDLRPQRAAARQPWDERELQGASQLPPRLRDQQHVSRICVNRAERRLVGGQVLGRVHPVPGGAELIGGEQAHDGGDIAGFRPAPGSATTRV